MLETSNGQSMKAVVMTAPGCFAISQVPVPAPGRNEALVRMQVVAICGSDPPLLAGHSCKDGLPPAYPFIPGHEGVGTIVKLGPDTQKFRLGERVIAESHLGCGICSSCREGRYNICLNFACQESGHRQYGFTAQGCYAEYCVYHERALHRIPDNVDDETAALSDTLATGLHAIRLTGIRPGGTTAVIGCGPVGLGLINLAKAMGSQVLAIGSAARLPLAIELGAAAALDFRSHTAPAEWVMQMTHQVGADQAFDCAGTSASVSTAIDCVRRGGKVGLVAVPCDPVMPLAVKRAMWDELTIAGSRGNPNTHDDVMAMLSAGTLQPGPIVTHRFQLDDFPAAIDALVRRADNAVKILVRI